MATHNTKDLKKRKGTLSISERQNRPGHKRQSHPQLLSPPRYPAVAGLPMLNALPTPPEEMCPQETRPQDLVPLMLHANADVCTQPSRYALMSLAEKVRVSNSTLVHNWGRFLVGAAVRELCDSAALLHGRRVISIIDLPTNFCIAPVDEQIYPSDDTTRLIAIVSNDGILLDVGMYDFEGPIFHRGSIVCGTYIHAPSQAK
ncbi:hypothetical protein GGI25_001759 [Coemansia spiralis]|uniref:Uncharacterized protein n=2 Tax=Coemansia TaxID=4863 RepID=A0A9W8KZS0_9FUNG|nr:hypothetical protein BX070DRAFT_250867 [Coemansia spiralis]KAJ1990568.1 hypothetical protein EDC05_003988 [Coemansia umbellata]KAJ2624901.1 hypothetical protein GGI26_001013 [Coemansia sp. RSA 1358]KAJ2679191.1 hypothetical protein GGI25_001759 [Coemansia spiralis]